MKLEEIPMWMEKYIHIITDGQCSTKKDVEEVTSNLKSWQFGVLAIINTRILLMKSLHNKKII